MLTSCTPLEDFDAYGTFADTRWQYVAADLARPEDLDSCLFEDILVFSGNGDYQRLIACRANAGTANLRGTWDFREEGSLLFIKERGGSGLTAGIGIRRYRFELRSDTLSLSEEFEDGTDRYTLVRE